MFSLQKLLGKEDKFFTLLEKSAEQARNSVQALVKLSKPEVKALFAEPAETPGTPSPTVSKPPTRHLLSAFLVLLCLFGFFFGFSFQAKRSGSPAGMTKIITVGALDPLFVGEKGPSGFETSLNFVSWSFFAVVVGGIAFGALWRIGREDQGKVPRDAAWWRDWWKQVGVWGALRDEALNELVREPDRLVGAIHAPGSPFVEGFMHGLARRGASRNTPAAQACDRRVGARPADRDGYAVWPFLETDRCAPSAEYLWHDWARPRDYAALAERWGLAWREADFADPNMGFGSQPK